MKYLSPTEIHIAAFVERAATMALPNSAHYRCQPSRKDAEYSTLWMRPRGAEWKAPLGSTSAPTLVGLHTPHGIVLAEPPALARRTKNILDAWISGDLWARKKPLLILPTVPQVECSYDETDGDAFHMLGDLQHALYSWLHEHLHRVYGKAARRGRELAYCIDQTNTLWARYQTLHKVFPTFAEVMPPKPFPMTTLEGLAPSNATRITLLLRKCPGFLNAVQTAKENRTGERPTQDELIEALAPARRAEKARYQRERRAKLSSGPAAGA